MGRAVGVAMARLGEVVGLGRWLARLELAVGMGVTTRQEARATAHVARDILHRKTHCSASTHARVLGAREVATVL